MTTDAMTVERAKEILQKAHDTGRFFESAGWLGFNEIEFLCKAYIVAREQDPVAWKWFDVAGEMYLDNIRPDDGYGRSFIEPLFANPPADHRVERCEALLAKLMLLANPATANGSKAWKRGVLTCAAQLEAALKPETE